MAFQTNNWLKGDGDRQRKFDPEPVTFTPHLIADTERHLSPDGAVIRLVITRKSDGYFQITMLDAAEMNELALAYVATLNETQKIDFIHKMTTK